MSLSYVDIQAKAEDIKFKHQAFIDGRYVDAVSKQTFDSVNPATGKVLTHVAACDGKDVDLAVKAARKAFESGVWAEASPQHRKNVLLRMADLLEKHHLELAILESLDMGKPISSSLGDVRGSVRTIRWYAEAIDKIYDQIAPTASDVLAMITREPLGVVAAVNPWNFPLFEACHRLAPGLVVGNSVILKPAEQAPLTCIYIAELASEAGIPDGVFSVLPGMGETAGQALGLHPDVDGVVFTGSVEVGKLFLKYSADSNMKRITLECGGKSPNIVFADCGDLDEVAQSSVAGAFNNQGEVCCATTRLIVADAIRDKLMDKLIQYTQAYRLGDPLNPDTTMGAIVDQAQMDKVLNYIAIGRKEGAELIVGGDRVYEETGGYFIEPTVFDQVKNSMTIAREEIFGPVLSVISFKDEDQAAKIANDTHYGLAASIWTQNINKAHKMARAIRAGVVSVNCINAGDITTPFGGYKQSGIGRVSSLWGLDPYQELKTTWIKLS